MKQKDPPSTKILLAPLVPVQTKQQMERAVTRVPPPPKRPRDRRPLWVIVAAVAFVGVGLWLLSIISTPPPVAPATASQALTAHGVVQPPGRANVGTIGGGVVEQLPVVVGQTVEAQQLVGRVNLQGQLELLTAPWRGTVTGVNVRLGDTVLPGTVMLTIADLSQYQVETTDVDEYLIGHIQANQMVSMTVEALDQAQMDGVVRTVSLQQQQTTSGTNYPVTIDLLKPNSDLRPGMTVRITFHQQPS